MADPMTLAVGGGILLTGWMMGRSSRRPKTPKPPKPICSCEHGSGTHENGVGRCHDEMKRPVKWRRGEYSSSMIASHFEWVSCACRAYDGPEPPLRSWVPPLPGLTLPELEDKRDA